MGCDSTFISWSDSSCIHASIWRKQIFSPDFGLEKLDSCGLVAYEIPLGRMAHTQSSVGPKRHIANQFISETLMQWSIVLFTITTQADPYPYFIGKDAKVQSHMARNWLSRVRLCMICCAPKPMFFLPPLSCCSGCLIAFSMQNSLGPEL